MENSKELFSLKNGGDWKIEKAFLYIATITEKPNYLEFKAKDDEWKICALSGRALDWVIPRLKNISTGLISLPFPYAVIANATLRKAYGLGLLASAIELGSPIIPIHYIDDEINDEEVPEFRWPQVGTVGSVSTPFTATRKISGFEHQPRPVR